MLMSKASIILFILLFLSLGTFLTIQFVPRQSLEKIQQQLSGNSEHQDNKTAPPPTTIQLASQGLPLLTSETQQIHVVVDSKEELDYLQLEIAYNPEAIIVIDIVPGNYFKKAEEVYEQINPVNGRISYALRCTEEDQCNQKDQSVAILTIQQTSYLNGKTMLKLMPKTLARIDNVSSPVTIGDELTIELGENDLYQDPENVTVYKPFK